VRAGADAHGALLAPARATAAADSTASRMDA
jgi:hypothetical protein